MRFYGTAQTAANSILRAFQSPSTLPAAIAPAFIKRKDGSPCRSWSWANQLLVALHGHSDARGFRQWQSVNRHVRKGEKSFSILSPVIKTRETDAGEKELFLLGFIRHVRVRSRSDRWRAVARSRSGTAAMD